MNNQVGVRTESEKEKFKRYIKKKTVFYKRQDLFDFYSFATQTKIEGRRSLQYVLSQPKQDKNKTKVKN